jgi:hypothetical protein
MSNIEKGGKEYMKWIYGVQKLLGSDAVNSDINLAEKDELYKLWKNGVTLETMEKRIELVRKSR